MKVELQASSAGFWQGRRALVTGATGMIGSWLIKDLLDRGGYVVAFIRDADPQSELYRSGDIERVTVVNGMLEDFWALERAINHNEVELVFHLGAQTIVGVAQRFPLATLEANIRGTYNLLEACRLHKELVRGIVVASSDKAYGAQPTLPYTEDMPLNGCHTYEVSKSCTDLIAQAYYHTYDLPTAITRCGNVYGGGDLNWSRIVPGTIRSILRGEPILVRSDGTYIRDYIYVKDAVLGYLRLAECLVNEGVRGEAFNLSGESPINVLRLVEIILKLMDCEHLMPQIINSAKGEIHNQYLSASKAKYLDWQTAYTLEEGLQETISWYRQFFRDRND